MPTIVQFRRGTTAENDNFTGAIGELSVDTTLDVIRVHDGTTVGGFALVGAAAAQTLTNKTLSGATLTGTTLAGNLIPAANVTYNLGNVTNSWNDLYLAGNTIYLGPLQLQALDANTLVVYKSDGVTQANIDAGAIDVSAISSGTSTIGISGSGGNAYITVGGTGNVLVVSTTGSNIAGTLNATGNANVGNLGTAGLITASGNITGSYFLGNGSQLTGIDAAGIQFGTSNVKVVSSGGNVATSVNGNANIVVVTGTGANIAGTLGVTGNITGGNLSGTGIVGTLTTAAQTNITSVGTLGALSVTGNANVGNIGATRGVFTGTGSFSGNVNMNNFNITSLATPSADTDAATKAYVDSVAQGLDTKASVVAATTANITLSGTQTVDGVVLIAGDRVLVKNQTTTANNGLYLCAAGSWTRTTDMDTWAEVPGAYVFVETGTTNADTGWVCTSNAGGTIGVTAITWTQFSGAGSFTAGTGLTLTGTTFSVNAAQTQITSVGTLTGLTLSSTLTGTTINAAAIGNSGATLTGTLQTAAQTNITSVGTITGGTWNSAIGSSATFAAGLSGANLASITGANVTGTVASATSATTAGTVTTAAQANITSVGTLTGLTINNATTAITNGGANGAGNIGSSSKYFNTVFATSTAALYADLAELYTADAEYMPGTVVEFGGTQEITMCQVADSHRVAGVVSENPAYVMNSGLSSEHVVKLALVGRVRCLVRGPVEAGDLLVSDTNGWAKVNNFPAAGRIIGKSLERSDQDGYVEIVVGKH